MAKSKVWTLIVGEDVEKDIEAILSWTAGTFGSRQADAYADLIWTTLDKLARDPFAAASRSREHDVRAGYRSMHVGRRGRHVVFYRMEEQDVVIVRILHDSMEASRHLPQHD